MFPGGKGNDSRGLGGGASLARRRLPMILSLQLIIVVSIKIDLQYIFLVPDGILNGVGRPTPSEGDAT
jgi:hypothetical protein